jgi:hypothetical protein
MRESQQPGELTRQSSDTADSSSLAASGDNSSAQALIPNTIYLPGIIHNRRELFQFAGFLIIPWVVSIPLAFQPVWTMPTLDSIVIRTIILIVTVWQLIGATLFCRAESKVGKVIIACIFDLPAFIIPFTAFWIINVVGFQ